MKDLNAVSDVDLVGLARDNDRAFAEIVRRFEKLLHYVIFTPGVLSADEAQDILQNTYLKIFSNLSSYQVSAGSFKDWICKIASNARCDYLRRRRAQTRRDAEKAQQNFCLSDYCRQHVKTRLVDVMQAKKILAKLAEHNPKQYEAVRMFYFDGLDSREIAERIGMTRSTALSRVFRGMNYMRRNVAGELEKVE